MAAPTISWNDFEKVEIRVGTVLTAERFPEARNPAYKMTIDFGPLGIRQTSAQITKRYDPVQLVGRQVLALTACPVMPPSRMSQPVEECWEGRPSCRPEVRGGAVPSRPLAGHRRDR